MSGAAKVNFSVRDLTSGVSSPLGGITFVSGTSEKGPFNNPSDVITGWSNFVEKYGGFIDGSDTPLLVKRLLDKGVSIRFNRIGHYSDIDDPSTLTATKATVSNNTRIFGFKDIKLDKNIDVKLNSSTIGTIPTGTGSVNPNLGKEISKLLEKQNGIRTAINSNAKVKIDSSNNLTDLLILVSNDGSTDISSLEFEYSDDQSDANYATVEYNGSISNGFVNSDNELLFKLEPKFEGAYYNNYTVMVLPASNGSSNYFDLNIIDKKDPSQNELYQNLSITDNDKEDTPNFLNNIVRKSKVFNVIYSDLANVTNLKPQVGVVEYTGGTDGDAPEDIDYIGSSTAATGFYAFDEYDDTYNLAVFDKVSDIVHTFGSDYAASRKDLNYFIHLEKSKDANTYISVKNGLKLNSAYTYVFGGNSKITDPRNAKVIEISSIADVLALAEKSSKDYGPWYSFAGPRRGIISNVLGVVPNFGTPARSLDLDLLANNRINMVINRNNDVKLWGNFSTQLADTQLKYISVVRLVIFLRKSLVPLLETFLEEPNDFPTWKRIWFTVKPFLDGLKTSRALFDYSWEGDQFATRLEDLQINKPDDVADGKYRIIFKIKPINSIQEINIVMVITRAGVSFEAVEL